MKKQNKEIRICHDENCPICDWCETLRIVDENMKHIRFECYKCGWIEK